MEVSDGEGDEEWGSLPFAISRIYEKRSLAKEAPYHSDGGDWTFFDCVTPKPDAVDFTVGVRKRKQGEDFSWGKAVLIVRDRQTGERFVTQFAGAFYGEVPTRPRLLTNITPLEVSTAIFGEDLKAEAGQYPVVAGGFSGVGGGWVATKWFLENDVSSAEVYFNYNLSEKRGEFSEKDPDYREDLLAIISAALRDGPRPERTPETDPNLTFEGPRIDEVCCLLPKSPRKWIFSPAGKHVLYIDGNALFGVNPSHPAQAKQLMRFEHQPDDLIALDDDLDRFLVKETIPETPGAWASTDPAQLWWVESGKKKLLRGPEEGLGWGEQPVAPNRRFVAAELWKDRMGDFGRYKVVAFLDLESGSTQLIDVRNVSLTQVGWSTDTDATQAVLVSNYWGNEEGTPKRVYLADPVTGKFAVSADIPVPERLRTVSPDGKQEAWFEGDSRLVIAERSTDVRRLFTIHEEDRSFVSDEGPKWADSRYIIFQSSKLALIDTTTMKMSYPMIEQAQFSISPDFRWALYEKQIDDNWALYLGRVVTTE